MNTISLIIPIYNRLSITQFGLKSLDQALNYYNKNSKKEYKFSVVVVDDGSTDGSSKWIEDNYPTIIVLKGSGDLWWTGSINMGCHYAVETLNADYLLLWNDDTICTEDYFYELEKFLKENPQYTDTILVSKVYWQHKTNILFNFGCYFNSNTGKKKLIGFNKEDVYNETIPIDWSGGMGTLIPAKIATSINYFDQQSFPQYFGDIDFFLRAKSKGYKAFAIPTLKIYNNLESTGISKARSFKEFKNVLLSNRSNLNFKQNYKFNLRHANAPISWFKFTGKYIFLTFKTLLNIIAERFLNR